MKNCRIISGLVASLLVLGFNLDARAVLANAWHIPDNSSDLGFNLRNPEFAIGTDITVTICSGVLTAFDVTASFTNSPASGARFYRIQFFP